MAMIEMIRLGSRGRCGQDYCDRLDILDFNLDWKVLSLALFSNYQHGGRTKTDGVMAEE